MLPEVRKPTSAGSPTDSRKHEASPHTGCCFLMIGWFKARHAGLVSESGLSHSHDQSPYQPSPLFFLGNLLPWLLSRQNQVCLLHPPQQLTEVPSNGRCEVKSLIVQVAKASSLSPLNITPIINPDCRSQNSTPSSSCQLLCSPSLPREDTGAETLSLGLCVLEIFTYFH